MKKLILAMVVAFALSVVSFAEDEHGTTAAGTEHQDMKTMTHKKETKKKKKDKKQMKTEEKKTTEETHPETHQ